MDDADRCGDEENGATVKLSFAGVNDRDATEDSVKLEENLEAAKEKTKQQERKHAVLFKFAKARTVTGIIKGIGDHVKDVSSMLML